MSSVLRLESVSKWYGAQRVLEQIDLSVASGELVVLLGPSGCGKSTVLNIVAGFEQPTRGRVSFDGRDLAGCPPQQRNVGMVFQSYALYPSKSVFDNMAFGLRMRRHAEADISRRVREVAAALQIVELLDRAPAQLSGGQRQRVAIGRAIVREPSLFLFDEPLSNLDAKLRGELRVEIKRLHARLRTGTLYVTHDHLEAMTLGTKIVVMRGGGVEQCGGPDEVYTRPRNAYVARFMCTASSWLTGRISRIDAKLCFCADELSIPLERYPFEHSGREATQALLCLRPEDLSLEPVPDGVPVEGLLTLMEPMGAEALCWFEVGKQSVAMRCRRQLALGLQGKVRLWMNVASISLFDRESELRL